MAQRSENVNEAEFLISCNAAVADVRQDFINSYRDVSASPVPPFPQDISDPGTIIIPLIFIHCFYLYRFLFFFLNSWREEKDFSLGVLRAKRTGTVYV